MRPIPVKPVIFAERMQHLLQSLNTPQRQAVEATEGPVMVIAGAGSGKTRVLTFRIAHLLQQGTDAFNILALTFTNKAAREMRERIVRLVGDADARNLWMGTFHSVFARILRSEASRMGYPSNFTIYDTEDSKKLLANLVKEMGLDKDIYKIKSLQNRISSFKNSLITPEVYRQEPELQEQDAAAKMPRLGDIYHAYTDRCFRAGAMDFDDLLLKTNQLFGTFPDVLAKYQNRFRYILVDEYQDTNHSQYVIVKALASRFENICVVGDDAQSIYSFRGANIQNILNFKRDYSDAQVYKLEQNYRSTKHIVEAANSLIKHNKEQLPKQVWTANQEGELITVFKAASDTEEGHYVARQIFERSRNEQRHYGHFAILYRTNAQSRSFEDALRKRNIPYRIYGGVSFYQRKEVKDVLAYIKLTQNVKDEEAFRRIINLPKRGIGGTTLDRLNVIAQENAVSLFEAAENPLMLSRSGINGPTCQKLSDFCAAIRSFAVEAQKHDAATATAFIVRNSGLLREMKEDKSPEGEARLQNIEELLNAINEFTDRQKEEEGGDPSLAAFLQDVALITDQDQNEGNEAEKVSLMTVHLAKGLEFPYVFVVGLEESLFPSMMAMNTRTELEEERRLFYVALTRAEVKAYLTFAHIRFRWGKTVDAEPSRFIDEIDEKHLDLQVPDHNPFQRPGFLPGSQLNFSGAIQPKGRPSTTPSGRHPQVKSKTPFIPKPGMRKVEAAAPSGSTNAADTYKQGDLVIHDRFGRGTITALEGPPEDLKATVEFDNGGEKKLLLRFAKLRKV